jgi:hypothetical protein
MIGQTNLLDQAAVKDIEAAIDELTRINQDIWRMVAEFGYPN